ncbi:MAG TPA: hypothetical protein VKR82_08630 [Candidatus Acidoferrales bacterium]|nr:hypothetical protein [Candidatus Acidoferrales bacterium]
MRIVPRMALVLCATCAALVAVGPAMAGDATLTYRKVFKGSVPEFVEIKVSDSGKCSFDIRQLAEPPMPEPFDISQMLRDKMFSLAAELGNFRSVDLEVHRSIANLGQKTFRYEKDGAAYETVFNYTLNNAGSQLQQIFEGLSRQQDHMQTLERRMKYDRLGVNDALLELQADLDNKVLPEPERLLPVLEQISNDSRILDMARVRARAMTAKIRGAK